MHELQAVGAMKIRVKNEFAAISLFCIPNALHYHVYCDQDDVYYFDGQITIAKKITETNDCYMNAGYYLRHLKKSGSSKKTYYLFGSFSKPCCCFFHYYYHFNNPLRVVYFHITIGLLAEQTQDSRISSKQFSPSSNNNICRS